MAAGDAIEWVNPRSRTRLESKLAYNPQPSILERIPPEIHFRILSYLSPNDRIILSLTCKRNYILHFSSLPNDNCNFGTDAHFKTLIGNLVAPQNAEMVMSDQGYAPFSENNAREERTERKIQIEKPLWPRLKEWMAPDWIWGCDEEPDFLMGRTHFVFLPKVALEQRRRERAKLGLKSWNEHKKSVQRKK